MSTIKELREKQQKLVADARSFVEQVTDDTPKDQADDLERQFEAAMAEHDKIGETIERMERLAAAEKRLEEPDPGAARLPDIEGRRRDADGGMEDNAETRKKVFRSLCQYGFGGLMPEERVIVEKMRGTVPDEYRAQTSTTSGGGYTIPEGFLPEITKSMLAFGPMLDPGVTRVINTATGNPLPWPTMDDTGNEGEILAENDPVNEQDISFGQKMLDAYMYSSKAIRVPFQLLQDSAFNVETDIINPAFGERIGRIVNRHLTVGTGSGQPNGIVTASSLGATASSGLILSFDDLMELEHSVDPAYRSAPGVRWMFHDSTLKALRKLKDGDGNYLWQPADARAGAPANVLNHPYVINQHMPEVGGVSKPIVFGDFNMYLVRRVLEFTMLRLVERYADNHQVGFLAFGRFDGELSNTAAIKHLQMQSG